MRRQHPHPEADIPVSRRILNQLQGASIDTGFEKEEWEIAEMAIDEWVRRHDPDALSTPAASGYQWKGLFLPDGTVLRTVFAGKNSHCLVEGDRILFNGKPVSPSGFVNAVGGIRRNAWLCTWVLFPDTNHWALADTLRARRRPRPAQALKRANEPIPDAPPSAVSAPPPDAAIGAPAAAKAPIVLASPPSDDDRLEALFRQELLPLLYRLCTLDGTHRAMVKELASGNGARINPNASARYGPINSLPAWLKWTPSGSATAVYAMPPHACPQTDAGAVSSRNMPSSTIKSTGLTR